MKKGLLLDRDGVVNKEIGRHVYHPEDLQLLPDIVPFIRKARELGFTVLVISNQSGIAQGWFGHEEVRNTNQRIQEELASEGVRIDEFFYSPHHPSKGASLSRKPDSLLIEKALAKYGIMPENALLFGDKERDVEAAEGAGVKGFLVEPNSSLLPFIGELERVCE